jgi:hypothetical protein
VPGKLVGTASVGRFGCWGGLDARKDIASLPKI